MRAKRNAADDSTNSGEGDSHIMTVSSSGE